LELDPDLGHGLVREELGRAKATLRGRVYEIPPGPWRVGRPLNEQGALGLLVVSGALGLRTSIQDRTTLELVGPGDLLRPWIELGPEITVPLEASWQAIERSRIVLLDREFTRASAHWPEIVARLMERLVLRSRRLCYQLAANTSPRIEERLLYSLWGLADRWGRVTDEGTCIDLALTHEQIAGLVCAQRPSVSVGLGKLRDQERVAYSRERYLLRGQIPGHVEALKEQVALL
jgi:CRP-like cAMP-binding protein